MELNDNCKNLTAKKLILKCLLTMLKAQLSPCANLLGYWLKSRLQNNSQLKVNLHGFQAWTAEYCHKSYSKGQIFAAFLELKASDLINLDQTEVTITVNCGNSLTQTIQPLPQIFLTSYDHQNRWLLLMMTVVGSFVVGLTPIVLGISESKPVFKHINISSSYSLLGESFVNQLD